MKGIRYVEESTDWAKRLDDASVREKNKKTRKRRILLYKKIQLTIAGYPTARGFFDFLRLIFESSRYRPARLDLHESGIIRKPFNF